MSTSSCGVSGNLESLTDEAVILLGRVKWSRSDSGGEDDEELIEFIPLDSLGAENSTGMSLQLNYTRVTYCTETPVNRILIAPWPHLFTKISNSDHRNDLNHLFGTNEGCWAAIRCPRRPLVTRLQQCDGVCGRGLARQLLCLPPDADFLLFGDERHGRSICWLWRRKQRVGEIEWQAECNQQQGPATAIAPYLTVSEFRTGNKLNFGTTSKRKIFDICGRVQAISSLHRIQNQRFFFIRLVEIESVGGGEEAIIVICRSDLFCTLWFHYGLRVNAVVIVQRLKLMRLFPGRPNRERLLLCADPAYDSSFRVLSDPPAAVVLSQQRQSQRTFQPSQMSVGGSFIDGESHILLDENSISSAVENFASGTQESSSTNFTSSGTVCYQGRITRIIDASRSLVELDSGKVCCYLLHQPICVWRHLLSLTGSDDCNGSWLVRLMNIHWILNGGNSNSNNNGGTAVEFVCCFNSSVEFVSFHLHRPGNNYRPVSINNLNSIPSREEQTLSAKDSILTGRAVGLLGRLLKAKPQSMDLFKDAKRRLIDTLFRLVPPQPVDIYGEFFDHENQCHINSMPVPLSAGPCLISVDDLLDLISAYKFHAHSAVTQAACFNQQHPQQRFGIANNRRLNFLIDSVPVGALFPNTASVWLLARLVATPATTLALMSESGKQALAVCNWPLVSSSSLADPGGVYLIRLCASNSSLATVVCEKLPGNIGGDGYSKQSVTLRFDDATSAISSTDDESDTSIHLLCPVRSNNSVFPALAAVSPTKILVFIESADPPSFIRSGFSDCAAAKSRRRLGRTISAVVVKITSLQDNKVFSLQKTDCRLEMEVSGTQALQSTVGVEAGRWFLLQGQFDIRSFEAGDSLYYCRLSGDDVENYAIDSQDSIQASVITAAHCLQILPYQSISASPPTPPGAIQLFVDDASWRDTVVPIYQGFLHHQRLYSVRELLMIACRSTASETGRDGSAAQQLSTGYLSLLFSFSGVIVAKYLQPAHFWLPAIAIATIDDRRSGNNDEHAADETIPFDNWSLSVPDGQVIVLKIASSFSSGDKQPAGAQIIEFIMEVDHRLQPYLPGAVPGATVTVERALVKSVRSQQQQQQRYFAIQTLCTVITVGDRLPRERRAMQIQHSALPKELIDAGDENSSIIGRSKSSNLPVRDGVYLCELPVGGQDNIITVHYRLIVDILFVERLSLKWICLQCQSVVSGGKCKTAGCPSLSAQFTAELVCHAVDPTGEAVFNVFGPDEVFDLLRLPTGVRKLLKKHAEEEGELVYAERAPWDQQNVASYSGDKNNFGTNNPSHEYDDLYLTNTFDSSSNCNTSSSIAACDKDNDIDDLDDEGGTNNQSRSRRKPCVVELEIFVRKFFPPEKSRTCQLVCRLAEEYGNGGWYAMAERLRPFADRLNGQIYLERTFRVQGVEVKTLCPPRLILTVMTVERLNCVQMADAIWQRRSLG